MNFMYFKLFSFDRFVYKILENHNIKTEKIAPGESLSGLVAFRDNASGTLTITMD